MLYTFSYRRQLRELEQMLNVLPTQTPALCREEENYLRKCEKSFRMLDMCVLVCLPPRRTVLRFVSLGLVIVGRRGALDGFRPAARSALRNSSWDCGTVVVCHSSLNSGSTSYMSVESLFHLDGH